VRSQGLAELNGTTSSAKLIVHFCERNSKQPGWESGYDMGMKAAQMEETEQLPLPSVRALDGGHVTAEKVATAVERIVALTHPVRVVAFGSRARGTHRPESDLDLAVILKDYDGKRDRRPIWNSDLNAHMSVDLLVMGEERHEFMKDSIISVHYDIENEGVTLYDASVGSIDFGAIARIAG
jgi:hypothetical protein